MKKFFTFALGLAAIMATPSAFAEVITVTDNTNLVAQFNKDRDPDQRDTVYVVGELTAKATTQLGRGGSVVFIGVNDPETGAKAQISTELAFPKNHADSALSLEFNNLRLRDVNGVGGNSKHFMNAKDTLQHFFGDLIFRNCDIYDICRSFFRMEVLAKSDGSKGDAGGVEYFEMTNCRFHYGNTQTNAMPLIYIGFPVIEMNISNNTFYDLPQLNSLIAFAYMTADNGRETLDFTFENNTVCAVPRYTFMLFDQFVTAESQFHINNNLFLYPNWSDDLNNVGCDEDSIANRKGVNIASIWGGIVNANNNVFQGFKPATNFIDSDDPEMTWQINENNLTMEDVELAWSDFVDAQLDDFTLSKAHKLYTAGVDGQPIGDINNYKDPSEIKAKATVSVNVEGSNSVEITITPQQTLYFVGDVVELSIDLKNTPHLTFNNFVKWEDGSTTLKRTVTLGESNNFVATVEEVPVYAAFTFPTAPAGGQNKAEIFYADHTAEGVTATAELWFAPEGEGYRKAVADDSRFRWRPAKFGEDDIEKQVPALSRQTLPESRLEGHMDYIVFTFSTLNANNVTFSAYVGTDNFACKKQVAEYSIDGGTTWKALASVELTERPATFSIGEGQLFGWDELKGTLPAEAEGKEEVQVRVIGDVTGEMVWNNVNGEVDNETANTFEYLTEVLISATTTDGIKAIPVDTKPALVEDNAPVYNILGQLVASPVAGQLYFKNGKKYIVK